MPQRDISDREPQHFDSLRPIVRFRPLLATFPTAVEISSEPTAASRKGDSRSTTVLIDERLQSFVLTDQDRKEDTVAMTFIDDEGVFTESSRLVHGAALQVEFGYRGRMSEPRAFIVRRLKLGAVQGRKWGQKRRGFLVTFEGLGPGILANREPGREFDVYENVKPSRVFTEVANRIQKELSSQGGPPLGVTIDVPAELDVRRSTIVRQSTETDKQFLARLASEYGLNVHFDTNTGIRVGPEREDAPAPYEIDLDGDVLLGFELDGNLMIPLPGEVQAVAWDARTRVPVNVRAVIEDPKKGHKDASAPRTMHNPESAASDSAPDTDKGLVEKGPDLVTVDGIATTVIPNARLGTKNLGRGTDSSARKKNVIIVDSRLTTAEKARPHSHRHLKKRIKKAWKLKARIVGDPSMRAGRTVNLRNFGTSYLDGLWYISEVKHTIDAAGYVTEIMARRPPGAHAGADGKKDFALTAVVKDTDKTAKEKVELQQGVGTLPGERTDVTLKEFNRSTGVSRPPPSPSRGSGG
jgi:phage protein D